MSVEHALLAQIRKNYLSSKIQYLINQEAVKGCEPGLYAACVPLEPTFTPVEYLIHGTDLIQSESPKQPLSAKVCVPDRVKIWISPEHGLNWVRAEQFLKSLSTIKYGIGFEIVGNGAAIGFYFVAHPVELPLLKTAFKSQYGKNQLTEACLRGYPKLGKPSPGNIAIADYYPTPPYSHLFTQPEELHTSPYETALAALSELPSTYTGILQVLFQPVSADHNWHQNINILLDLEYAVKLLSGFSPSQNVPTQPPSGELHGMARDIRVKAHNDKPVYAVALRLAVYGDNPENEEYLQKLKLFANLFQHGGRPLEYVSSSDYRKIFSNLEIGRMLENCLSYRPGFILNSSELASIIHLPSATSLDSKEMPVQILEPLTIKNEKLRTGTPIGICNNIGNKEIVCIPDNIRLRSTHLIARHGMGKSTLLEHMILSDIEHGAGVAVLDPHGDLIYRLTHLIPEQYIEKVIYFHPGDPNWVPLWNPIKTVPGQDLSRTVDDIVAAIKNIVQGWGDRLENLLRHAIFALLHLPQATLLDISNILRKKSRESEILIQSIQATIDNQTSKLFWKNDFPRYNNQDLSPPQHKLSKLLLSGTISLMLSQPESRINFREIMDNGKILLIDLSGIGAETRELLGSFSLSLLHITALSRSNIPIEKRAPFHIYCDEAHRFLAASIEDLIPEARKFGVSLTLAHQYLKQFDQKTRDGVLTTGSTIIFNVDLNDARYLAKDLQESIKPEDLAKFEIGEAIARIGTDIVKLATFKPLALNAPETREAILNNSHHKYYRPVEEVRSLLKREQRQGTEIVLDEICEDLNAEDFKYEEFD